jgi:hypothetical protein
MPIYTKAQLGAFTVSEILDFTPDNILSFINTFVDPKTGALSTAPNRVRQLEWIDGAFAEKNMMVVGSTTKKYISARSFNNTKTMDQILPLFMPLLTESQIKGLTVNQCSELSDKQINALPLESTIVVLSSGKTVIMNIERFTPNLNKVKLDAITITNFDAATNLDATIDTSLKETNIFNFQLYLLPLSFLDDYPDSVVLIKRLIKLCSPSQLAIFKSIESNFDFEEDFYPSESFNPMSDMIKLSPWQIPLLTIDQIKQSTTLQIQVMTKIQIQALTNEQIAALNETQVQALTNDQIQHFTRSQMEGFPVEYLSTDKISSITKSQLLGVSLARQFMLNTYTIIHIRVGGGGQGGGGQDGPGGGG